MTSSLHADLLIVQICQFLDDGDGIHRLHGPSRYLSRLPGVVVVDCDAQHHLLPLLSEKADVLILAAFDADIFSLVEQRHAAGRITVFEANDYFFGMQSWFPLLASWRDRTLQNSFVQMLALADGVQTS